jgi:5-methylcytosine-specific restriction endonuclease McrA
MAAPKDPEKYKLWIERLSESHKGQKVSEETRKKLSDTHKGHPNYLISHSEETKKKISKTMKGVKPWNTGKKCPQISKSKLGDNNPKYWLNKKRSNETKRKISEKLKGREAWNKGKPQHQTRGVKNGNWNPDIDHKENDLIRGRVEWKNWRQEVFKRDDYTCKKCDKRGLYLHPHHIKNFSEHEDLRFDVVNGITFCKECHINFHTIYGFKNNDEIQIKEYI